MASGSNPLYPFLSHKAQDLLRQYGNILDSQEITRDLLLKFKGISPADLYQFCFALLSQTGVSLEECQSVTPEVLEKVNTAIVNMMVCRVQDQDFHASTFWRNAAIEKSLFIALVALIYPDLTAGIRAYQALRDEVAKKVESSPAAAAWADYCRTAPLEKNYEVLIHNAIFGVRGPNGLPLEGDALLVLRDLRAKLVAGPASQSMVGGEESADEEDEPCCSCCSGFWSSDHRSSAAEQAPLRGSIQYGTGSGHE